MTYLLIAAAALCRIAPHPPNVAPLAAMALLGGAYLPKKQAFLFPLLAMALSDIFLGWHSTLPFVYGSFLLTVFLGRRLAGERSPGGVLRACLTGSFAFFIITNFGVWLTQSLYSKDPAGLAACYAAAIPFYRNTMLGDLFFTAVLFSIEALASRAHPRTAYGER